MVHGRANAVFAAHLMYSVNLVAIEQDTLTQGRLPGVNVRANANVTHLGNVKSHFNPSLMKITYILHNIVKFSIIFKPFLGKTTFALTGQRLPAILMI
jgi:hypothetical protein